MRLINADKLLHQGYDYVVDRIAYDSCNKSMDIEDIPTVQAIPLDKVKQTREEIKQNAYPIVHGVNNHDMGMTLDGIFQVLDNLIAESET